jgi:hypothetical protein
VDGKLKRDHEVLELFLDGHVQKDSCNHELEVYPDSDFELIYQFRHTPCSYPLNCLSWINPQYPGVFLRCFFPDFRDDEAATRICNLFDDLNYQIPTGCFAINGNNGNVLFKNAFYVGEFELNEILVRHFFQTSFETVDMYWEAVMEAVFGTDAGAPHR